MSLRGFLMGLAITAVSVVSASAGTIIQYDTQGVGSGPPTPTAALVAAINPGTGVTGIDVTRGAGLTPVSASFALNSSGWDNLESTDYYQFGFNTTTKYYVDQLTVGLRSSNTGPGYVNLWYSKDGAAYTKLNSVSPIKLIGTDFTNLTANLSEIGLVSTGLTFRLMVDPANATSAGANANPPVGDGKISADGTFRFASFSPSAGVFVNPEITGSVIPEPSSVIMAGMGLAVVVGAGLRRRRAAA